MTKLTFTKEQIIKALETEPLRQGAFFHLSAGEPYVDFEAMWKAAKTCKVCAVGAILRSKFDQLPNRFNPNHYGNPVTRGKCIGVSLKQQLEEENYLGALSIYFESMPEISVTKLTEFVDKNFPDEITVTA